MVGVSGLDAGFADMYLLRHIYMAIYLRLQNGIVDAGGWTPHTRRQLYLGAGAPGSGGGCLDRPSMGCSWGCCIVALNVGYH